MEIVRLHIAGGGLRSSVSAKMMVILFVLALWYEVGANQPGIEGEMYGNIGSIATLRCQWSEDFSKLEWRTSVVNETNFINADLQVRYTPTSDTVLYRDEERYSFNKSGLALTVKNFTKNDVARYWCRLDTAPSSEPSFFDVYKREPVTNGKQTMTFKGQTVDPDATLKAEVGVSYDFKFSVSGILPAATFKWMLDSTSIPETTVNTSQTDGLINSTSTATWMPADGEAGTSKTLTCTVTNGAPDDVTVTFKVEVTEKVSPKPKTGGVPPWAIAIIVIAVVVVIGIIGGVVYYFNKRQS